jgi:cytochrome c biogenesis protein CcmG, thiol:disulfide interchange protein DsbE
MRNLILALLLLCSVALMATETAPDFKLPDVNNKDVQLADLLNKGPVLIDFWATWCVPCKKGMAALNELALKYDSLTIVAVSIDAPKDVPKAKSYLKTNDYKFIGLFDSEKKLAKKLNVVNPPRTLILNKTGEIVFSHDGYEAGTEKIYEVKIRELLNLPPEEEKVEDKVEESVLPCGQTESCGSCQP